MHIDECDWPWCKSDMSLSLRDLHCLGPLSFHSSGSRVETFTSWCNLKMRRCGVCMRVIQICGVRVHTWEGLESQICGFWMCTWEGIENQIWKDQESQIFGIWMLESWTWICTWKELKSWIWILCAWKGLESWIGEIKYVIWTPHFAFRHFRTIEATWELWRTFPVSSREVYQTLRVQARITDGTLVD